MSKVNEVNFSLKVMIDKGKNKVLFAEAGSDFGDVLLSFLTLPLGTIVKLLQKHNGDNASVFGSLGTLYNSLANLDNNHFWAGQRKLMLLNPRNPFEAECRKLKLNLDDTEATEYFTCEDWLCGYHDGNPRHSNISMYYDTYICCCGGIMNREIDMTESEMEKKDTHSRGGFALKMISFLIGDDLKMVPNAAGSIFQTLRKLGVVDTDGAEQRIVAMGFSEVLDLLKGSFTLTDLILGIKKMDRPAIQFEPVHQTENAEIPNSKKMSLKVMVQKSTNELLFALAEDAFVDFLLSFLTIPLPGVEWLLDGNSSLRSIDNLYNSSDDDLIKYLKNKHLEKSLFKPKLPPMYLSENQLFSLKEQATPKLYYTRNYGKETEFLSYHKISNSSKVAIFNDPKGNVRGNR